MLGFTDKEMKIELVCSQWLQSESLGELLLELRQSVSNLVCFPLKCV